MLEDIYNSLVALLSVVIMLCLAAAYIHDVYFEETAIILCIIEVIVAVSTIALISGSAAYDTSLRTHVKGARTQKKAKLDKALRKEAIRMSKSLKH